MAKPKLNLPQLRRDNRQALLVLAVAGLLTLVLLVVRAAGPLVSYEPETGTLAGNVLVKSGSNVSGGNYVEFTAGTPPTPPPGSWPPAGAKMVKPSDNLSNLVSNNPAGTTFALDSGKYSGALPLKAGNKYIGNPNNRPEFVGGGINSAPFIKANVDNVTVENIVAHHYGPHNTGERGGLVGNSGGKGWVFRNVEFSHTANNIVDFGNNWLMEDSELHHSGRHWGTGGTNSTIKRVEAHNIANDTDGIPGQSSSNRGSKFAFSKGWVMEDLWVHDVDGVCLWFDIANENAKIIRPLIENCAKSGIFLEVSFGPFLIESPVVRNAGQDQSGPEGWPAHAGILISITPNVTINNPHVSGGRHGITAITWSHPQINGDAKGTTIWGMDRIGDVGIQNIAINGGTITNIGAGFDAGATGGHQPGTLPTKNIHWNNVKFDADARFKTLHIN